MEQLPYTISHKYEIYSGEALKNNIHDTIINVNYINEKILEKQKTKKLITLPLYQIKMLLPFKQPLIMFAIECINEYSDEESVICMCLLLSFNLTKKPDQFNKTEWNDILLKSGLLNDNKEFILQKYRNIMTQIVQNIKNYVVLYKYPNESLYIIKKNNKQKCFINHHKFIDNLLKYFP